MKQQRVVNTLPITARRTKNKSKTIQIRYVSKKASYDPYLRLASAIVINAFENYRKAHNFINNPPPDKVGGIVEKRARKAIEEIELDLLSDTNPAINYLHANKHAIDKPKIKRTLQDLKNNTWLKR